MTLYILPSFYSSLILRAAFLLGLIRIALHFIHTTAVVAPMLVIWKPLSLQQTACQQLSSLNGVAPGLKSISIDCR